MKGLGSKWGDLVTRAGVHSKDAGRHVQAARLCLLVPPMPGGVLTGYSSQ
jgi:hypothetical protein